MSTFNLILNNTLKTYNNNFLPNFKSDGIDRLLKTVFLTFLEKYNIKNKFIFFKESLSNFLIKNEKEEEFINYFYKIQRVYHILNRFIYNYKFKKAKIVVNTDMCMNELNINDKKVICIFHNQSKYLFLINDLLQIINTALTNSSSFFADPKCIKNPYNNLPFNKSTLYKIYFYMKLNTEYRPELFIRFFEVDFNLTIFKYKNVYLLRQYVIQNYVYKSASNILIESIKKMILYFNQYCKQTRLKCKIQIDDNFPNDKLINIMRPYLLLYIMSKYSYLQHEQKDAAFFLNRSLIKFYKYNPQFGRKKIKIVTKTVNFQKKIVGKIIEFDNNHIKFNNIETQNSNFLSDHLICEENRLNERYITRNILYFSLIYDEREPSDDETESTSNDVEDEFSEDEDNEDISIS